MSLTPPHSSLLLVRLHFLSPFLRSLFKFLSFLIFLFIPVFLCSHHGPPFPSPFLLISSSLTKCCPKLPSPWASGFPCLNPFRGLEGGSTYQPKGDIHRVRVSIWEYRQVPGDGRGRTEGSRVGRQGKWGKGTDQVGEGCGVGRLRGEPPPQLDSGVPSTFSQAPPPDRHMVELGWDVVAAKASETTPAGVRLPQDGFENHPAQIRERFAGRGEHFPPPALRTSLRFAEIKARKAFCLLRPP